MGLEERNGPPKKKLKQAQLPFFSSPNCNNKPASSNKRKVDPSSDDEIQVAKVVCKSPGSLVEVEKENLDSNKSVSVDKSEIKDKSNDKSKGDQEKKASVDKSETKEKSKGDQEKKVSVGKSETKEKSKGDQEKKVTVDKSETKEKSKGGQEKKVSVDKSETKEKSKGGQEKKVSVGKSKIKDNSNDKCKGEEDKKKVVENKPNVIVTTDSDDGDLAKETVHHPHEDVPERQSNVKIKTKEDDDEELATPLDASFVDEKESTNDDSNSKESNEESNQKVKVTTQSDEVNTSGLSDTQPNYSVTSEDEVSASSETPSSCGTPKTPLRKLTPKQLKIREESLKKKEEKERLRKAKMAERTRQHEERMRLKAEQKEEKKKRAEEKRQQLRAELEQKTEEKRLKAEEKKLKREKEEEEKRLKAEEKLKKKEEKKREEEAKEEEKKKKAELKLLDQKKEEQAKEAFVSYFKKEAGGGGATPAPRPPTTTNKSTNLQHQMDRAKFMPFPMKSDMRLAVVNRRCLEKSDKIRLDKLINGEMKSNEDDLYLKGLKSGSYKVKTSDPTWPISTWQEEQHDVIIVESVGGGNVGTELDESEVVKTTEGPNQKRKSYRAKLLQFCENQRPAYWGTWRKSTQAISARRPFSMDKTLLDYEVDSDCEWEEEGEGESLEDDEKERSDDEEEVNGENGYVLDKQFVPHGYLSDEEAQEEENDDQSPEAQKLRLTVLKEEFDEEMKQKAERLKPRLLGCVWISNGTTEVAQGSLYASLFQYRSVWDEDSGPIDLSGDPINQSPVSGGSLSSSKTKPFPSNVVESLVKMVHGSHLSHIQLVKDFNETVLKDFPNASISKQAISRKIKEVASKVHDKMGKLVWCVNSEMRSNFDLKSIEEMTPTHTTPQTPVEKPKDTFLETFLKGKTQPAAKKRISLTPVDNQKRNKGVMEEAAAASTNNKSESPVLPTPKIELSQKKKKVPFTTLPRTPQQNPSTRPSLHKDTPRPPVNAFIDRDKNTPHIDLTDNSN